MTIERNDCRQEPKEHGTWPLAGTKYYGHPSDILATALGADEKRAILASWASDLFAVESHPKLGQSSGVTKPIRCQDIRDALGLLDRSTPGPNEADCRRPS